MRVACGPGAVLGEREERARLQHAPGLGEELLAVGHVHRHVLAVGAVEGVVGVGQLLAVALLDRDAVGEVEQGSELRRRLDERRRDVNPGHRAVEALREVARGAAEPAADVQDMVTGGDRQAVAELDGGGKAASVEVIDRRQILDRQRVERPVRILQRGNDQGVNVAPGPVLRNRGCFGHRPPPLHPPGPQRSSRTTARYKHSRHREPGSVRGSGLGGLAYCGGAVRRVHRTGGGPSRRAGQLVREQLPRLGKPPRDRRRRPGGA
jgi:hypothetical protein